MPKFRPARPVELIALGAVLLVVFTFGAVYNHRHRGGLPPEMGAPVNNLSQAAGEEFSESEVDPVAAEAQGTAEAYLRKRIIHCGDSYYFYTTNWLSEIKGSYRISVSGSPPARREISLADSLNGVRQSPLLWEGEVAVAMDAYHVAASEGGAIIPTSFQTDWKQNGRLSYKIEKHPSGWKVLSDLWEITCDDVNHVLATGQRGRNAS